MSGGGHERGTSLKADVRTIPIWDPSVRLSVLQEERVGTCPL